MPGYGFWLRSSIPGWGWWCVCVGLGFSCISLFLVGVLGRVASGVRPVRFPPPSSGAACGPGLCGGCHGWGFSPPLLLLFFSGLRGGGVVVLGPVVSWLCGVRRCLSRSWAPWSPSPLPLWFGLRLFLLFFLPVARHFSGGVCAGVPGVSFPQALRWSCARGGPLLSAGCRRVGQGGPPVFFRGVRGCRLWCCLAGAVARLLWSGCAASRLCDCLLPPPPFFSAGAHSWLGGGSPPSVLFFFWGGGVCLFLPLPSPGWCTHWSAFGVAYRVAVGAAIGWAVPRPNGSGGLCTRLAWWPVLSG